MSDGLKQDLLGALLGAVVILLFIGGLMAIALVGSWLGGGCG
jgi:hypothetical protein